MPTLEQVQMRLSDRVNNLKPSATLAVSAKVSQLRAAGVDVIGFGAGEPDFDTPQVIKQAAIDALNAGKTKYTATEGDLEARSAVAEKLRRENKIECGHKDIVISVGAKHSIYLALQCLLDPGKEQEVIIPTPAWVSYRPMIELAGGEAVELPGGVENDFKITPAQLRKAITKKTAAIIINSPCNPTGMMYSPDELRELAEVLAKRERMVIITDEIYEKLIFGQIEHLSLGSLESIADRVVTINGLSKAFAMTGWRVGYLCAPGDDGAIAQAAARLQGQMTSNITSFIYPAIVKALTSCSAEVEKMRQAFAERATLMHLLVSSMPELRCPRPAGAFYLFPDISAHFGKKTPGGARISSAQSFAEALLEEAHVAVVPGEDFGAAAAGNVRLSFACSDQMIEEGCRRMDAWLKKLK